MAVRDVILSQIEQVASEQEKTLGPMTDQSVLLDTGLDSLCFAVLVARLEDELGLDPFSDTQTAHHPVTLGDLIRIYENAAAVV